MLDLVSKEKVSEFTQDPCPESALVLEVSPMLFLGTLDDFLELLRRIDALWRGINSWNFAIEQKCKAVDY